MSGGGGLQKPLWERCPGSLWAPGRRCHPKMNSGRLLLGTCLEACLRTLDTLGLHSCKGGGRDEGADFSAGPAGVRHLQSAQILQV